MIRKNFCSSLPYPPTSLLPLPLFSPYLSSPPTSPTLPTSPTSPTSPTPPTSPTSPLPPRPPLPPPPPLPPLPPLTRHFRVDRLLDDFYRHNHIIKVIISTAANIFKAKNIICHASHMINSITISSAIGKIGIAEIGTGS